MLEDSSACSWRGQQGISPDSAFGPPERGTSLDSQFNSDFVSNFDTPPDTWLPEGKPGKVFKPFNEGYIQLLHALARLLRAPPLGGEATGEEGVLPVPTDLRDYPKGRSERMQTKCMEPHPWSMVSQLGSKILNRSRVSAKLRHGSSSVGQLKRDRRRTSDRFYGPE